MRAKRETYSTVTHAYYIDVVTPYELITRPLFVPVSLVPKLRSRY